MSQCGLRRDPDPAQMRDMIDLESLLLTETDRVEWKQTPRDQAILQAVCALANDLGGSRRAGWLIIGVSPRGQVLGIPHEELDVEQQKLVSRLSSVKILPTPSYTVQALPSGEKHLLAVRVEPSAVPPVVKVDGVAWIRRGTVTERARDADLLRLQERRPAHLLPFDQRPVPGARLDDLDLVELRGRYEAERIDAQDVEEWPSLEQWLRQRELVVFDGGEPVPNAAAVLVHGRAPSTLIPGATIEFVRYGGCDFDASVTSRRTIAGSLPQQLDILWTQLGNHLVDVPAPASGMREPYLPEYPLEALRELARNLVQHRLYEGTHAPGRVEWFDDRIQFSNPGGPFRQASAGELGDFSDYRNQQVTSELVALGYVEKLGRGLRRVRSLLQKNGNPPLKVETDGFTIVTVFRRATHQDPVVARQSRE